MAQARIDGLPDTITQHLTRLRQRICHRFRELRPLLAGRRYRSSDPPFICDRDAIGPPYANCTPR